MRWLERVDPLGEGRVYCNARQAWVVRVLQFREGDYEGTIGFGWIGSPWQDVRKVHEA